MGQSQSDKQKSCTCTSCHKNSAGNFAKSVKSSEDDSNVDASKNNTLSDVSPSAGDHGSKISVSYIECDDITMSDSNDYGIPSASSTTDNSTNSQARRDSDNKEPENGTKQTEQNTKTGAISKSRKSLSTLTSNLRKVNSRAVSLTTKQSKKNEENNCATNSTPVKKKRPNWVMKFNCAKLKCGRNSSHNQNAHKQERRKTKNDNCVCTCYRKTNDSCLSRNAFHPDNFNSINSMNVSVCSVNSVPGNDGSRASTGQAIATIICEKQLTPVTMECCKSSDNAQASICERLEQAQQETLSGDDQTPVRNSFGHATSLVRDRNSMFGYNIDSELELCRCKDANQMTSSGAKQSKSGDGVNDEAAAPANRNNAVGESLYGSLTNLSGAVETNNQSLNPISARHNESDSISFVCNHSQNAAQLFCHSGNIELPNQPIPRCIDWLCANNHPDTAPNTSRPVLHLPPENCVRQQPAIFYQTFSPVTRNVSNTEHQQRPPADSVSRNAAAENIHSGANDSSSPEARESGTDNNNQTLTAVQFGQRRCLQLVCPTDMSVESLRALFQSHFNIDAVTKCHTQIDYVHYLVPDLLQITSCSFYWGKMDRYEAERLLDGKPEGTFLLRDSAQEEFLFSVSFRKYGRSLHARIEQWNHKFSFDSHDPGVYSSDTVCGLIEHYKDPTCCMFFEPILTLPLHRNFTFTLQHLARATITNKLKYDTIDVLQLPNCLKAYLKEYHYRQRVRIKRFEGELQYVDFNPT